MAFCRYFIWFGLLVVAATGCWKLAGQALTEKSSTVQQRGVRRRQTTFSLVNSMTREEMLLMEGFYTLIDVSISDDGALHSDQQIQGYKNVEAMFCKVNWDLQHDDSTMSQSFSELVETSACHEKDNIILVNLSNVTHQAKSLDQALKDRLSHGPRPLKLSGMSFQQGGFPLDGTLPSTQGYVYSDPPAFNSIVQFCNFHPCDDNKVVSILQDVMFWMRRSSFDERRRHIVVNFGSAVKDYMSIVTRAFPSMPWTIQYKNSVEDVN